MRDYVTEKHPHLRGEDIPPSKLSRRFMETPPPAWGRLEQAKRDFGEMGNTPTCVGKTKLPALNLCGLRKHPHLRGEDITKMRTL